MLCEAISPGLGFFKAMSSAMSARGTDRARALCLFTDWRGWSLPRAYATQNVFYFLYFKAPGPFFQCEKKEERNKQSRNGVSSHPFDR